MIARLTSKGQLTIPKPVRDRLRLRAGDRIEFLFDEQDAVKMIAVSSTIKRLKGSLPKPAKIVSLEDMQKAIEQASSEHVRD
jgi:AbrB family looped-hinge helix DNA binding protein